MTITAVLTALRGLGIHVVQIEYSGSGDSGQVDDVIGRVLDEAVALPDELVQALDTWAWEQIEQSYHDGFWNNDGGFGEFTIDVQSGEVEWVHNDAYTQHNQTTHDFEITPDDTCETPPVVF